LRSHQSIELLQKKALVAAKAWVSLYRKLEIISSLGGVIIHTSQSSRTFNSWLGSASLHILTNN